MFHYCQYLSSLPDISKWNTQNVKDMNSMFCYCKLLSSLPDISKWNTQNVTDMREMFSGCNQNLNIPKKFIEKNQFIMNIYILFIKNMKFYYY